jgi:hypothetical protein
MNDKREPRYDWFFDKARGDLGENLFLKEILEKAEVKTDYQWQSTGNLFIEIECWRDGKMQPSGIVTTESKYWVSICPVGDLSPVIFSFPTNLVRKACIGKSVVEMNKGANPSKGYLVKITEIMCLVNEARENNRKAS